MDFRTTGICSIDLDKVNVDKELIWITNYNQKTIGKLPGQIIFNGPATILKFNDGSKTIVKAKEDTEFDPVMGFLVAYFQKYSGLTKTEANKYLVDVRKQYERTVEKPVEDGVRTDD